jgi:hypothetical protein
VVVFGGVAVVRPALDPPGELAGRPVVGDGDDVVDVAAVGRFVTSRRMFAVPIPHLERPAQGAGKRRRFPLAGAVAERVAISTSAAARRWEAVRVIPSRWSAR